MCHTLTFTYMHLPLLICIYLHSYAPTITHMHLPSLTFTYTQLPSLTCTIFTHIHLSLLIHLPSLICFYRHLYALTCTHTQFVESFAPIFTYTYAPSSLPLNRIYLHLYALSSLIRRYLYFYALNNRNERQIGQIVISVSFGIGLLLYFLQPVFCENVVFLLL